MAAGQADGAAPALQTTDLSFCLVPGGPELLRKVSFSLPRKARCVLVGQNGAGKTTLLELLSGGKMAPAGAVKVCGEDPFRGASGHKVALVQGGWRGCDALSEERASFLKIWQLLGLQEGETATDERTERLHKTLGIKKLIDRYLGSLSDGERRKVELARKLREPREVVLLDEATIDLDLMARKAVLDFLAEEDATVVNVTHVFDGLEPWATHLLQLHDGEVVRCEEVAPQGPAPWPQAGGLFALVGTWLRESCGGAVDCAMPQAAVNSPDAAEGGGGSVVEVKSLSFAYATWCPVALCLDKLELPRGCRCILVGPNGAGKSSLLTVLGGRRMVAQGDVCVLGHRAFHDHIQLDKLVALLSSEWKRQVSELSAGRALSFKEVSASALQDLVASGFDMQLLASRMLRLIQMLKIDPTKPMGALSDGNMRRVQIALKLLRPSKVVLVDEVTADLDVLARQSLLDFLREESEAGCTVVYCTHIMDGLDGWATHMLRMRLGGLSGELSALQDGPAAERLLPTVLRMLEEDAALPEPPRATEPPRAPAGKKEDENLPSGWLSRHATQAGAYGSYAWNADKGSEDTWSFGSVAPAPGPVKPAQTSAVAMQPGPAPLGCPRPSLPLTRARARTRTRAQSPFGAPGAPPAPGGGPAPFGQGPAAFGQGAAAPFGQGAVPGQGPGPFGQGAVPGQGAPPFGQGMGALGAPSPFGGFGGAPSPFDQATQMQPGAAIPPDAAMASAPGSAAASAPTQAAAAKKDDNPFGSGPRSNNMSLQELIAAGIVQPETGP